VKPRLQPFPDQYSFAGARCEGFRRFGNIVPVNFAQAVAASLTRFLVRVRPVAMSA